MSFQTKRIIGTVALLPLAAVILVIGCDPSVRHEVLSFFFDGVPPLGTDLSPGEPGSVVSRPKKWLPAEKPAREVDPQALSSRHQARDCQKCHAAASRWDGKQLLRPVPGLCYDCHTDYKADAYVHGPVAVGVCLFCHKSHQSKFPKLQTNRLPDLCYLCHAEEDIASIAAHQGEAVAICTRCHDPHAGSDRILLKHPMATQEDPNWASLSQ